MKNRRWLHLMTFIFILTPAGLSAQSVELQNSIEALKTGVEPGVLVRVLARLPVTFEPETLLPDKTAIMGQRAAVSRVKAALLETMGAVKAPVIAPLEGLPYVVLELDREGLDALVRSGQVLSVEEDVPEKAFLEDSGSLMRAPEAWNVGHTGLGQTVAILDTGVDANHPFLAGKIVAQACFSSTSQADNSTTLCPDGAESQIGDNAGMDCDSSIAGCGHGTHVAGIAAGKGTPFSGIAREASIIAIQVFSRFDDPEVCSPFSSPCALTYPSDQIQALHHVASLANQFKIAAVNMSLGGGRYTSPCDSKERKEQIDGLRSLNIATVVASGNEGFTDSLAAPACISSAISVGCSSKSDGICPSSNRAGFLDLLATGSDIESSVKGGGFDAKSGTSMAAPHVTGAWAVLRSKHENANVDEIEDKLKNNGKQIYDWHTDIEFPRVRLVLEEEEQSDLTIAKEVEPVNVNVNQIVHYTITLNNRGPSDASGVALTDTMPNGVDLVSDLPAGCHETGGQITCDLGQMAKDFSKSMIFEMTPVEQGIVTNIAVVEADQLDPKLANNEVTELAFVGVVELPVNAPPTEGSINTFREKDLFKLQVVEQGRHEIETHGETNVMITLFGPNNPTREIGQDLDGGDNGQGPNAKLVGELEPATYFAEVRHQELFGTGAYQISVKQLP